MRTLSTSAAFLIFATAASAPADTVKVSWGYNSPAAPLRILAPDGATPVPGADLNGAPGTGFALEFGYYSQATAANPFAGTWTPVFGKGKANELFANASLGDGRSTADTTDVRFGTTAVVDTTIPGTLTNLPAAGQLMAIRYYNTAQSSAAAYYGVASNPAWKWVAPAAIPPIPISFNISQSGTVFQGAAFASTNQRTFTGQPQITSQPTNISGAAGSPVSLSVAATGPGLTYQWFFNGAAIQGATNATFSAALDNTSAGSYSVAITDVYGDTATGGPYVVSLTTPSLIAQDTPAMPLLAQAMLAAALMALAFRFLPLKLSRG